MLMSGSCLCGGVKYETQGPLTAVTRCHCLQCRKASGAEFATNGNVPAAQFRLVSGQELMGEYESSPGKVRVFCRRCGSPLLKRDASRPDQLRLRLGCLDTELDEGPLCHLFVGEKPRWSEIADALPQFEKRPEGKP